MTHSIQRQSTLSCLVINTTLSHDLALMASISQISSFLFVIVCGKYLKQKKFGVKCNAFVMKMENRASFPYSNDKRKKRRIFPLFTIGDERKIKDYVGDVRGENLQVLPDFGNFTMVVPPFITENQKLRSEESHNGAASNPKTYFAEGTLGDIMSRKEGNETIFSKEKVSPLTRDGLVTTYTTSDSLSSRYGIENPLDRMVLTANGNLQRLVSSYYDSPVEVVIDEAGTCFSHSTDDLSQHSITCDRLVHLTVHNQTFCTAKSVVTVRCKTCQELVVSGSVGIGQLFRYLDILPEFELHDAAPYETGGFWREYSLTCPQLSCRIHENFPKSIWGIAAPPSTIDDAG